MRVSTLYPGLRAFHTNDSALFFGREKETEVLLASIDRDPVIVVDGPSGCGKSSLIRAGIIPQLKASHRTVVYTFVIENILQDVQHAIRHVPGMEDVPDDFVDAILMLYDHSLSRPVSAETLHAQEGQNRVICELIGDAFTASELKAFCRDRPAFEAALRDFGPGFSFNAMIEALIEYCLRRVLLLDLLREIRELNPRQFDRHRDRLEINRLSLDFIPSHVSKGENLTLEPTQLGKPVVLIVDQFEQALLPSHPKEALEAFIKGIYRLMNEPICCATVVIVVRADWLYYLRASVRDSYSHLRFSIEFDIDPLGVQAARTAIVAPLEAHGIPYDEAVITEITTCLQRTSIEPIGRPDIQPIQLQIVIRALCEQAERRGVPTEAFTKENLELSGSVESILRDFFARSVGKRSEPWRLLSRFVAHGGQTGQAVRRSELLSIPAAQEAETELVSLVNRGFLEAFEVEGTGDVHFRLAHDYLVHEIVKYIQDNEEELGWKQAEDWLASGTIEWCESLKNGTQDGLLLEYKRYLRIYEHKDKLTLTDEAIKLLTLTALQYGHKGVSYWILRSTDSEPSIYLSIQKLLAAEPDVQSSARTAFSGSMHSAAPPTQLLGAKERTLLHTKLRDAMLSPKDAEERDAAARALWTFQEFETRKERLKIGVIVARRWMQDHYRQIASYVITASLVMALLLGAFFVWNQLQGTWQTVQTLTAGPIPFVITDPKDPKVIYAVTVGGSTSREGSSLYTQKESEWTCLSRDFAKGWPTAFVVVPSASHSVFYASFYGPGMMRSEDGGESWRSINKGLPSHALTALVSDPDDEQILYVATDDFRGVQKSSDGGDSWDWYDHKGEIFGAAISKMIHTGANGGALVASTTDGRILLHHRHSSEWELVSAWAKGSVVALTVSLSDDRVLYAGTNRGIVLRSEDGGETWEVMGQIANQISIITMAIDLTDPSRVYASSYGNGGHTLWKSVDGGRTWEMLPAVGLPRISVVTLVLPESRPHRLVAATTQGIFSSHDDGATWQQEQLGVPLASVGRLAISAKYSAPVYATVGGSVYSNSEGDLREWTMGQGLLAEGIRTIVVDPDDPLIAYTGAQILGEWSVFVTRDGGRTWTSTEPPSLKPVVPDTTALALAKTSQGQSVLYAGTIGCGVLRSTDEGKTWETFHRSFCREDSDPHMPTDVSFLAVDVQNSDLVYATAGQEFFYSDDGGYTWHQQKPGIKSPILGMVTDPVEAGFVYLITGSDGFWRSEDGGKTWQKPTSQPFESTELVSIAAIPGQSQCLIVGASNGGIWATSSGGNRWRSIRGNLSVSSVSTIATSAALDGRILVGTPNDGIAVFVPGKLFENTDQ